MSSFNVQLISLGDVPTQPWRNGGGTTRELLISPSAGVWDLRISVADIERDGPFSVFDGVERWMSVVEGEGVALDFADGEKTLRFSDTPICFDGANAPSCRLIAGPTRDLNLMIRSGRGVVRKVRPGSAWKEPFAMRGLFTTTPGRWRDGSNDVIVPADTLLWCQPSSHVNPDWTFEPTDSVATARAWWLGFTPNRST